MDHGDRAGGEALVGRAGTIVRRLRPDIHVNVELMTLPGTRWIYDGETATIRTAFEAMEAAGPYGFISALATWAAALDGDDDAVRRRLATLLAGDLALLRRPDLHLPPALCWLAWAATLVGDRSAGARLRPLLEPLRPYLVQAAPLVWLGQLPEWHIGRLELLAGSPDAAVDELRAAVARADALDLTRFTGWTRVDLAIALHRRQRPDDRDEATEVLARGEALAERHQMHWVINQASIARAELEGREPPAPAQTIGRLARQVAGPVGARAGSGSARTQP